MQNRCLAEGEVRGRTGRECDAGLCFPHESIEAGSTQTMQEVGERPGGPGPEAGCSQGDREWSETAGFDACGCGVGGGVAAGPR